jgi:hypothetical protein
MRHRGTPAPLDVPTLAAILRRLPAAGRVLLKEQPQLKLMLESSWGGLLDGTVGEALRHARQLRGAILMERDADELEAELARLDAIEAMKATAVPETPLERRRPGPRERDDSAHLIAMRALIEAGTEASPWAAARAVVGAENESAIKRLVTKYRRWEAAGFPAFPA